MYPVLLGPFQIQGHARVVVQDTLGQPLGLLAATASVHQGPILAVVLVAVPLVELGPILAVGQGAVQLVELGPTLAVGQALMRGPSPWEVRLQ